MGLWFVCTKNRVWPFLTVIKARQTNKARTKWVLIWMGNCIDGDFFLQVNLIRESAYQGAEWQLLTMGDRIDLLH